MKDKNQAQDGLPLRNLNANSGAGGWNRAETGPGADVLHSCVLQLFYNVAM